MSFIYSVRSEQWKWSSHIAKQMLRNGGKVLLAFWLSLWSSCGGPASRPAEVTPLLHSPPPCFQGRVRAMASIQRPSGQWKFWSIEVDRRSASTGRCTDAMGIVNKMNRVSQLCFLWDERVLDRMWSMRRWDTTVQTGPFNLWHFRGRWGSLAVLEKWSVVLRELIRGWASEFIKWWFLRGCYL